MTEGLPVSSLIPKFAPELVPGDIVLVRLPETTGLNYGWRPAALNSRGAAWHVVIEKPLVNYSFRGSPDSGERWSDESNRSYAATLLDQELKLIMLLNERVFIRPRLFHE